MSYNNVGKVWTPDSFGEYLKTLKRPDWAKRVCLHHCASPSLAQRPQGFKAQHLENLKSFYQGMGWTRGPHFFTDEDQIWGMTPPTIKGIHSVGWNSSAIGIEALGDYDNEDPKTGRGLQVWMTTASATFELLHWLGLPINKDTITFHRLDKVTSKTCPGTKVSLDWFIALTQQAEDWKDLSKNTADHSHKPEIAVDKSEFVPLAATLKSHGFTDQQIKKSLRREGKNFFWIDDHLEFAYYDSKTETTMVPLSEIQNIKP